MAQYAEPLSALSAVYGPNVRMPQLDRSAGIGMLDGVHHMSVHCKIA